MSTPSAAPAVPAPAKFELVDGATFALPDGSEVTVRDGQLELWDGRRLPLPAPGEAITVEKTVPRADGGTTRIKHTIRLNEAPPAAPVEEAPARPFAGAWVQGDGAKGGGETAEGKGQDVKGGAEPLPDGEVAPVAAASAPVEGALAPAPGENSAASHQPAEDEADHAARGPEESPAAIAEAMESQLPDVPTEKPESPIVPGEPRVMGVNCGRKTLRDMLWGSIPESALDNDEDELPTARAKGLLNPAHSIKEEDEEDHGEDHEEEPHEETHEEPLGSSENADESFEFVEGKDGEEEKEPTVVPIDIPTADPTTKVTLLAFDSPHTKATKHGHDEEKELSTDKTQEVSEPLIEKVEKATRICSAPKDDDTSDDTQEREEKTNDQNSGPSSLSEDTPEEKKANDEEPRIVPVDIPTADPVTKVTLLTFDTPVEKHPCEEEKKDPERPDESRYVGAKEIPEKSPESYSPVPDVVKESQEKPQPMRQNEEAIPEPKDHDDAEDPKPKEKAPGRIVAMEVPTGDPVTKITMVGFEKAPENAEPTHDEKEKAKPVSSQQTSEDHPMKRQLSRQDKVQSSSRLVDDAGNPVPVRVGVPLFDEPPAEEPKPSDKPGRSDASEGTLSPSEPQVASPEPRQNETHHDLHLKLTPILRSLESEKPAAAATNGERSARPAPSEDRKGTVPPNTPAVAEDRDITAEDGTGDPDAEAVSVPKVVSYYESISPGKRPVSPEEERRARSQEPETTAVPKIVNFAVPMQPQKVYLGSEESEEMEDTPVPRKEQPRVDLAPEPHVGKQEHRQIMVPVRGAPDELDPLSAMVEAETMTEEKKPDEENEPKEEEKQGDEEKREEKPDKPAPPVYNPALFEPEPKRPLILTSELTEVPADDELSPPYEPGVHDARTLPIGRKAVVTEQPPPFADDERTDPTDPFLPDEPRPGYKAKQDGWLNTCFDLCCCCWAP